MIAVLPRQTSWRRTWWQHPEVSLAAVAAVAWIGVLALHLGSAGVPSTDHGMTGQHHDMASAGGDSSVSVPHLGGGSFLGALAVWVLMATAMMLPTALPEARSIALNGKWKRRQRGPALFAVGYLVSWSLLGVVLLCAVRLIGPNNTGPWAVSGALAIAAVWEWTRWKRLLLRACHRLPSIPPNGLLADRACVRAGIRNGAQCTGSCAPMMVPMALAPHTVGLSLMLFLFALMCVEKLSRRGVDYLRPGALALALAATLVATGALIA